MFDKINFKAVLDDIEVYIYSVKNGKYTYYFQRSMPLEYSKHPVIQLKRAWISETHDIFGGMTRFFPMSEIEIQGYLFFDNYDVTHHYNYESGKYENGKETSNDYLMVGWGQGFFELGDGISIIGGACQYITETGRSIDLCSMGNYDLLPYSEAFSFFCNGKEYWGENYRRITVEDCQIISGHP